MASLWSLAADRAADSPDRLAIWTAQASLTHREQFDAAHALAEALSDARGGLGLDRGAWIGLSLPNAACFAAALLALRRLEHPVALVSPAYRADELRAIVQGARLQALLTPASLATRQAMWVGGRIVPLPPVAGAPALALLMLPPADSAGTALDHPAALVKFSSGSSGVPKGIVLSESQLLAEAATVCTTMALDGSDRILTTVPLIHSYGFDLGVLPMLLVGAALVLPDFFVPGRLLSDLRGHDASVFLGVPEQYRRWLDAEPSFASLPRLRHLLSCTAPLDVELIREFHARSGWPICQHYGSSETGAVTLHVAAQVMQRADSVGRAMAGVGLRIVDDQGQTLGPGQEGEVIVSSAAVAAGYLMGGPAQSLLGGGSFHTGDLGLLDADGFLYLRGRRDQIINIDGLKVSPQEVADALLRHPAVREAGAVAGRSPEGRSQVWAAVALKQAVSAAELRAHCHQRLAAYKVPARIVEMEALPRGPSGKLRLRAEDFGG